MRGREVVLVVVRRSLREVSDDGCGSHMAGRKDERMKRRKKSDYQSYGMTRTAAMRTNEICGEMAVCGWEHEWEHEIDTFCFLSFVLT
jgi:hypothetical protein